MSDLWVPVISPSPAVMGICFVICLVPVAIGFLGPVAILSSFVLMDGLYEARLSLITLSKDSFILAISAAIGVMTLSILVGLLATFRSGQLGRVLAGMAAWAMHFREQFWRLAS